MPFPPILQQVQDERKAIFKTAALPGGGVFIPLILNLLKDERPAAESNFQDCCVARLRDIIPLILNWLKDERSAAESNFQDCCATRSRRLGPPIVGIRR